MMKVMMMMRLKMKKTSLDLPLAFLLHKYNKI